MVQQSAKKAGSFGQSFLNKNQMGRNKSDNPKKTMSVRVTPKNEPILKKMVIEKDKELNENEKAN